MTKADYLAEQGASLKRQREKLGLTREEVAAGIGASESAVGFWENGRSVMSAYSALLLRLYFRREQCKKNAARQAAANEASAQ